MDGFYVAKIQKLSDRRPDDTIEEASEVPDKEKMTMEVEEDKADEKDQMGKNQTQKKKFNKKRTAEDDRKAEKRRKKGAKISFPPVQKQSGKKKKLDAKMTRPRRRKASANE